MRGLTAKEALAHDMLRRAVNQGCSAGGSLVRNEPFPTNAAPLALPAALGNLADRHDYALKLVGELEERIDRILGYDDAEKSMPELPGTVNVLPHRVSDAVNYEASRVQSGIIDRLNRLLRLLEI